MLNQTNGRTIFVILSLIIIVTPTIGVAHAQMIQTPDQPIGFTAKPVSPTSINLNWSPPQNNGGTPITGYRIDYRIAPSTTYSMLVTLNNVTTYTHTSLTTDKTYIYRVYAINAIGTGYPSIEMMSTPTGNSASSIVSNQTNSIPPTSTQSQNQVATVQPIPQISQQEITSFFTDKTSYHIGDKIYFFGTTMNNTGPLTILIFDPTNKFVMLASAIADNNHAFQAVIDTSTSDNLQRFSFKGMYNAIAFIANKENGKTVDFVFSPGGSPVILFPPISLTASTVSSTEIDLRWSSPTNTGGVQLSEYKIERDDGTGFKPIQNLQSTSYQDTSLTPNKLYSYRVSAVNQAGTNDPSNVATAVTLSSPTQTASTQGSTTDQSQASLDDLLKKRLEDAKRLQDLLNGKNSGSPSTTVNAITPTITITTDKSSLVMGDTLVISGTVTSTVPGTPLTILILDPNGIAVHAVQMDISQDGKYTDTIKVAGAAWKTSGIHTIQVHYRLSTAQTTFTLSVPSSVSSSPSNLNTPLKNLNPNTKLHPLNIVTVPKPFGNSTVLQLVIVYNATPIFDDNLLLYNVAVNFEKVRSIITGSGNSTAILQSIINDLDKQRMILETEKQNIKVYNPDDSFTQEYYNWQMEYSVTHELESLPQGILYGMQHGMSLQAVLNEDEQNMQHILANYDVNGPQTVVIPSFVKSIAEQWGSNKISDSDFLYTVQYYLNDGTMVIPNIQTGSNSTSPTSPIPNWVRSAAKDWSENIGDSDQFEKGIRYLFEADYLPVSVSGIPPIEIIQSHTLYAKNTLSQNGNTVGAESSTNSLPGKNLLLRDGEWVKYEISNLESSSTDPLLDAELKSLAVNSLALRDNTGSILSTTSFKTTINHSLGPNATIVYSITLENGTEKQAPVSVFSLKNYHGVPIAIPLDLKEGETIPISPNLEPLKVDGTKTLQIGNKKVDAFELSASTIKFMEGGSVETDYQMFYDENTGIMLVKSMNMLLSASNGVSAHASMTLNAVDMSDNILQPRTVPTSVAIINPTQQDLNNIDEARHNQTIAAEVNIGNDKTETKSIDNSVSVQTTSTTPDSLGVKVSAPDQTGPKVIVFNLNATTINVTNLKDLGVMYDGKLISPSPNMDAILHAKSTDNPSFAIVVTQSGVQVLVLVPHFSTHTITLTNMSKVIPAVPEFGPIVGIITIMSLIGSIIISKKFFIATRIQ